MTSSRPPSYHAMAAIGNARTEHQCLSLYQAQLDAPTRGALTMFKPDGELHSLWFLPPPCLHRHRRIMPSDWPTGEDLETCDDCGLFRLVHEKGAGSAWCPIDPEEARRAAMWWLKTQEVGIDGKCEWCRARSFRHMVAVGGRWRCPVPACSTRIEYGAEPWGAPPGRDTSEAGAAWAWL